MVVAGFSKEEGRWRQRSERECLFRGQCLVFVALLQVDEGSTLTPAARGEPRAAATQAKGPQLRSRQGVGSTVWGAAEKCAVTAYPRAFQRADRETSSTLAHSALQTAGGGLGPALFLASCCPPGKISTVNFQGERRCSLVRRDRATSAKSR